MTRMPAPTVAGAGQAATGETIEIHAACLAYLGRGILIRGASGAGKSDLALRLVAAGADLVADDRVRLERRGEQVRASCPPAAGLPDGLVELRQQGIFALAPKPRTDIALVVEARPGAALERLPEHRTVTLLGLQLPVVDLDPAAASAVARIGTIILAHRQA